MSCYPPYRRENKSLSNSDYFEGIAPSDGSTTSKLSSSGSNAGHGMESDGSPPQHLSKFFNDDQPWNFKQHQTNPIGEARLISDVCRIYAELVLVETKCINLDKQQNETQADLSVVEWLSLISLHESLLAKHYSFFLASQHPSASQGLNLLAFEYTMTARLWRYGIHSLLELLRQKLPISWDYMLDFILNAYTMLTILLENVTAFRENWLECLGDLARYRMAVEEAGDRTLWADISRYWYNKLAEFSPEVGRVQLHLGILARPDELLQLFYYTKALVSICPFPNTRERMEILFKASEGQILTQHTIVTAFIATHGALFKKRPAGQFIPLANRFLSLLRGEARSLGRQGVYIMSCNFASILQHGDQDAVIVTEFSQKKSAADAYEFALNSTAGLDMELKIKEVSDPKLHLSPMASQASALAFHTLAVVLDYPGDPCVYPCVHISLAFIWGLALHPRAMQKVDKFIPWANIARFLNTVIDSDISSGKIEDDNFPSDDGTTRQLPEDFLIRGQLWSQLYFPDKFFDGAPEENDRPEIEQSSAVIPRKLRCLWLGVQIAKVVATSVQVPFLIKKIRLIDLTCSSVIGSHTAIADSTSLSGHLAMHQLQSLVEISKAEDLDRHFYDCGM